MRLSNLIIHANSSKLILNDSALKSKPSKDYGLPPQGILKGSSHKAPEANTEEEFLSGGKVQLYFYDISLAVFM